MNIVFWYFFLLAFLFNESIAQQLAKPQTCTIDASLGRNPISPLIYGINFATADAIQNAGIQLTRWGGNPTSRYNYKTDVANRAKDHYFQNIPECFDDGRGCIPRPVDPQTQSAANVFLQQAYDLDISTSMTVPMLGWLPSGTIKYDHPFDCSCKRTETPDQDSFDDYDLDCGNGLVDGVYDANCTGWNVSMPTPAGWVGGWVSYITQQYGQSSGSRIYQLDNEPNLWHETHYDVRGHLPMSYDELWNKTKATALEILQADPTAPISGPGEWGWKNYMCSALDLVQVDICTVNSPDRSSHGGLELVAWLLQQANQFEKSTGQRLLHYLDLHYYPDALSGLGPQRTRSLWDPTYVDSSWIATEIRLIRRMKDWVNTYYPGTKLMIGEYDWSDHNNDYGLLAYVETLGIFGREGLDAATAWNPPLPTDRAYAAFLLFRNYDGKGSKFADLSIQCTPEGITDATISCYAALGEGYMTLIVVNEGAPRNFDFNLNDFEVDEDGQAQLWGPTTTGSNIVFYNNVNFTDGYGIIPAFPGTSVRLLVIPGWPTESLPTTLPTVVIPSSIPWTDPNITDAPSSTGIPPSSGPSSNRTLSRTSCGNVTRQGNKVAVPLCADGNVMAMTLSIIVVAIVLMM